MDLDSAEQCDHLGMSRDQIPSFESDFFESTAYLKFAELQCFLWLSLPGDYRVTDEALLAETT